MVLLFPSHHMASLLLLTWHLSSPPIAAACPFLWPPPPSHSLAAAAAAPSSPSLKQPSLEIPSRSDLAFRRFRVEVAMERVELYSMPTIQNGGLM
ncbi:uncharacterized protein LOC104584395 isoform X2 [Brachypodium distachyon]|uniref:uncharacterized protein LOC104584395 isoform X2 n=1 Tax=Brachypodium distachyon TaxID=15368 RepID=UPI00052FDF3D|nr:uncharacterized protein LOC104584395 isoform X2 [Brachypodium distachyon]|eukprot:XP_010237236.1 uncharacterized protein LOC104584395 isoform X2 [Brachypodium distachyon]